MPGSLDPNYDLKVPGSRPCCCSCRVGSHWGILIPIAGLRESAEGSLRESPWDGKGKFHFYLNLWDCWHLWQNRSKTEGSSEGSSLISRLVTLSQQARGNCGPLCRGSLQPVLPIRRQPTSLQLVLVLSIRCLQIGGCLWNLLYYKSPFLPSKTTTAPITWTASYTVLSSPLKFDTLEKLIFPFLFVALIPRTLVPLRDSDHLSHLSKYHLWIAK